MADFVTPTIRTFQVFPDLPPALAPLLELAKNFWWMWHPDSTDLFRRLDRDLWEQVYHNPVKLLGAIDQNKLMAQEPSLGGRAALDALLAFAVMNRAFFSSLTPADRAAGFSHPEYGPLTVDWIVHMMAGHQIHHLKQLDTIASHAGKAIPGR